MSNENQKKPGGGSGTIAVPEESQRHYQTIPHSLRAIGTISYFSFIQPLQRIYVWTLHPQ